MRMILNLWSGAFRTAALSIFVLLMLLFVAPVAARPKPPAAHRTTDHTTCRAGPVATTPAPTAHIYSRQNRRQPFG